MDRSRAGPPPARAVHTGPPPARNTYTGPPPDRSRAAYTGPPPPRNYAFKRKEEPRHRIEKRPPGSSGERPVRPFSNSYRPPYRPNQSAFHSQNQYTSFGYNQNSLGYNRPAVGYNNSSWRPRGSFRGRPHSGQAGVWRPRPERLERDRIPDNSSRGISPQKSWKKAKIVIKERDLSDEESEDSRIDFTETSGQNEESGHSYSTSKYDGEAESGQIYETNEESGQLYETNEESGQVYETNEESGQLYDANEESGQVYETNEESGQVYADESAQIYEQDEKAEQVDEAQNSNQVHEDNHQEDEQDSDYDQDYIEEQIDKIDNEIARLETQLASIRAKKEDEDISTEKKVEVFKNSWDDLDKPSLNDDELIEKIYSENRKVSVYSNNEKVLVNIDLAYADFKKGVSSENLDLLGYADCSILPITPETVYSLLLKDLENYENVSPVILKHISSQRKDHLIRITSLALEYKERNFVWKRKIDQLVNKYEKRKSDLPAVGVALPSPVIPSAPSPVTPGSQAGSSRNRRAGFRSDYVKSESELASALIALGVDPAEVELDSPKHVPPDDPSRLATEPPMILDPVEKNLLQSFKSTIGLVKDPVKSLKDFNSSLELNWHIEEKEYFKTKLLQYGKNFRKIASYLPLKTTADCIQYFYREKINLGFKQAIRRGVNVGQRGRKRGKQRHDVENIRSTFRIWKLNSDEELPRQRQGLPQYVSWDPTEQGKEDEFNFDDPDELNTPWTNEEQDAALKALEEYGKDYSSISQILGNKSEGQIRSFYSNYKRKQKKMKLEEMKQIMKEMRDPGSRHVNDLSQETLDWEFDSRRRGKKRNAKHREDDLMKKKPKNKTEIEPVSTNTLGNMDDISRRTISYWSVSEKAQFITSLKLHGRKWELISKDVGTKSAVQVRNFFSNSRAKLNLDQILAENGNNAVEANEVKSEDVSASDVKGNIGILLNASDLEEALGDNQQSSSSQGYKIPSPSQGKFTLPLPLISAVPSPRTILLDPEFSEKSILPPMRNISFSHPDINRGLGITKIDTKGSFDNQEVIVKTTDENSKDFEVHSEGLDNSRIAILPDEETHSTAHKDKAEVENTIIIDSDPIINSPVDSNVDSKLDSIEKESDSRKDFVEQEYNTSALTHSGEIASLKGGCNENDEEEQKNLTVPSFVGNVKEKEYKLVELDDSIPEIPQEEKLNTDQIVNNPGSCNVDIQPAQEQKES